MRTQVRDRRSRVDAPTVVSFERGLAAVEESDPIVVVEASLSGVPGRRAVAPATGLDVVSQIPRSNE
jgi:hypothetical protein